MQHQVLIVSPYFPPSNLAGVHRARHLAKHLPAAGWQPTIVCVDEAFHEQPTDPQLAKLLPHDLEVLKVSALSARWTRPLGLGEISLRAWRPLRRAVIQAAQSGRYRAVLITGEPYYPMLLGAEIRRAGVPVVLDFQDPWVSEWGRKEPLFSKAGASSFLAGVLEPRALRWADFVTSVSDIQNAQMARRYRWLDPTRMKAIPIGGDPEDYDIVRCNPERDPLNEHSEDRFNLTYVGTIWPAVLETLQVLLGACAWIREKYPRFYERLQLNFVGSSAVPGDVNGYRVLPLAQAIGVADVVREIPERRPYFEALSVQARSDALLMLGSSEEHYTASKVFGVLMSGRPFLSLFHSRSSAHAISNNAGGGICLAFSSPEELSQLVPKVGEAIMILAAKAASLAPPNPTAYAPFDARSVAQSFAEVFERACA